jgi:hypothetical protein
MSLVRFACLCDQCGKRSSEYSSWLSCRDCGEDVCDDCDLSDRRDPEFGRTLCKRCH